MTVLHLVGLWFVLAGCSGNKGVDDSGPDGGDTADDPYVHCSDGMAWYEGDLYLSEQSQGDAQAGPRDQHREAADRRPVAQQHAQRRRHQWQRDLQDGQVLVHCCCLSMAAMSSSSTVP